MVCYLHLMKTSHIFLQHLGTQTISHSQRNAYCWSGFADSGCKANKNSWRKHHVHLIWTLKRSFTRSSQIQLRREKLNVQRIRDAFAGISNSEYKHRIWPHSSQIQLRKEQKQSCKENRNVFTGISNSDSVRVKYQIQPNTSHAPNFAEATSR